MFDLIQSAVNRLYFFIFHHCHLCLQILVNSKHSGTKEVIQMVFDATLLAHICIDGGRPSMESNSWYFRFQSKAHCIGHNTHLIFAFLSELHCEPLGCIFLFLRIARQNFQK
jgi:hypothetical protein